MEKGKNEEWELLRNKRDLKERDVLKIVLKRYLWENEFNSKE